MLDNALYYPYIAYNDSTWLKAMAMYYENIYRIVSDNIIPDDPEDIQPLLKDGSIDAMIDPVPHRISIELHAFSSNGNMKKELT